jgi:DNA-binding SARP family transcriptional activator
LGDSLEAERTMKRALDAAEGLDVPGGLSEGLVARAAIRRAVGQYGASLEDAEAAVALSARMTFRLSSCSARLERAASLLALGDIAPGVREAQRIHDEVAPMGATYLHLKADLVLAEVDLRDGDAASAVARIAEHADYILSESPNWMLAMYIRAFPRLLGVVAKAVGVSELPSHMLSMILPAYAGPAVAAASAVLEPRQLAALSQRLLGRKGSGRRISDLPRDDVCRVRLFGGMEVVTSGGPVPSKAWRKRKARLLFAMLAVRRGGDVPTDQILDYLWPEFPEDKALNNMYVVWSAMKHALSPGLQRGEPCPYVERVGTVCHLVSGNVTSDLDEFEARLADGRKADHEGEVGSAIAAYRAVMETYRGELLPGDAYDDWFRSARDRCKHEYSDAALRLAALLESTGEVPEALQVLRHQIAEGQRSAAIETYLSCRSRLTEDLGIDPSAETNKLYQHVLGMESNQDESQWSPAERAIYEREEFFRNRPTW